MKIGLNATCFNDRPSGARQRFVGIYGELVKRLPDAEFVVYEPADCRVAAWFDGASNVTARRTPLPSVGRAQKFIHGLRYWATALRRERFDVFEAFNLPLVKAPHGRTLLTIHDVRALHLWPGAFERRAFSFFLGRALGDIDHVVTVSEAMKEEILGFFPAAPVSVVYNGLNARDFAPVPDPVLSAARRKLGLPEKYLLAVGHLERRKNYLRLIDAMALLRERGCEESLVIVGNDSGEMQAISERIRIKRLSGRVKIVGGLSDLEVRCAYQLCSLFIFPSSYEGFGIPVLEAMAARKPMVLSDIPAFREITQDQAAYFDPHDSESMAVAVENVLSSESLQARLIEYGDQRVKAFGFSALAEHLADLYETSA